MDTGTIISGVGHAGLILWVLMGDWLFQPQDQPAIAATEVSLLSEAEYDALVAAAPSTPDPAKQPSLPEVTPPAPVEPTLDAAEPQPEPVQEPAPAQEPPTPQAVPELEAAPAAVEVAPVPEPEVTETLPDQPTPDVVPEEALALPENTPPPVDQAAPRVAPIPTVAPEPEVQIAEEAVAAVTPEAAPDAPLVTEDQQATALEEAGTVIETEATEEVVEAPTTAPASSIRPKSRPTRTAAAEPAEAVTQPVAEAAPDEPAVDAAAEAIAAALAEATAEDSGVAEGGNTAPQGPPITSGEKDGLRVAVSACWIVDTGSQSADVTITIGVSMNPDGTVVGNSLQLISAEGGTDAAQRSAFEKARRAILRCEKGGYPLPPEKYEQWKDIEMVFNPDGMRLR